MLYNKIEEFIPFSKRDTEVFKEATVKSDKKVVIDLIN